MSMQPESNVIGTFYTMKVTIGATVAEGAGINMSVPNSMGAGQTTISIDGHEDGPGQTSVGASVGPGSRYTTGSWAGANTDSWTAPDIPGYTFVGWYSVASDVTNNSSYGSYTANYTSLVSSNKTITFGNMRSSANMHYCCSMAASTKILISNCIRAVYTELPKYTLTLTAGTGGTVSGGGSYASGTTATATATPNTGYNFVQWSDGVTTNPRSIVMSSNKSLTASFALKTYTVSYNRGSYGSGTNSSATKTHGTALTLPGATFTRTDYLQTGWASDAAGSTKVYDLSASYTANAAVTLYPYWTYTTHTLSLSANDSNLGSVSGAGTYGHGRTATATATPNLRVAGFTKWSDNVTTNPRSVAMNSDVSLAATFSAKTYTTTYGVQNSSGMGGGVSLNSATPVTGTSTFQHAWGGSYSFAATCNTGYRFKRWAVYLKTVDENGTVGSSETVVYPSWSASMTWTSGPVNVSGSTITRSATGAYVVSKIMAEFEAQSYTVSAAVAKTASSYGRWDSSTTPGSVSGAGTKSYNTSCSLTATANSNYAFAKWNDDSTANPKTFTVTGNSSWTAYFTGVTKTLTLVATSTGRGTIAFTDGGGASREYGTQAKLKATPAAHYKFVKWTDGSTDAERTVNVSADASFQAEFAANDTVTIKTAVTPTGGGTVSGGGSKTYDSSVTLVATPSANWEFVAWQDGLATASRTFTADETTAAVTYTATFRKVAYAVSASGANCTVAKSVVSGTERSAGVYEHGTVLKLTVTPTTHYHFTQWSDGNTSNPRQVTVTAAASYSATAAIDYHTLSATTESATKGTVSATLVSGAGSAGSYAYGSVVELVATPTSEYQFDRWSDGDTSATRRITVDSDKTVVAQFKVKTYTVTVAAGSGGAASIDGQTGTTATFDYGTSVTIRATPSDHYSFAKWSDNTTTNPKTFTVTGNHTFTATFAVDKYTVTATAGTGGSVTGTADYDYGSQATLVATANAHYSLVGWYDSANNRVATTAIYRPTVTGAATYTARFAMDRHTVSATVSGSGTVTGDGEYDYGSTATLTATAAAHSHFVKWTSGGTDYSTNATITPTVSSDLAFTAVFAIDTHTVTTGVVDAGTGSVTAGGTYAYGTSVSLTATPSANYHLVEWYKNGAATGIKTSVLSFVVEENVEYKAKFTIGEYVISASVVPVGCGGSVTGTGKYNEGETATLAAVDSSQYAFDKWSDGVTTRSRSVAVTGPASFTAQFKLKSFTLTVAANDGTKGSVTGGGTYEYTASETVKLTATAASHCRFLGWKKDGGSTYVSTAAVLYVSVTANATYTACFEAETYAITTSAIGPGTVTGAGTYAYGTSVQLSAVPESGYSFTSWSDGSVANPRTVTVTGNASYSASFVKQATERGRVFAPRHPSLFW